MTEIPEHLLNRAREARERSAGNDPDRIRARAEASGQARERLIGGGMFDEPPIGGLFDREKLGEILSDRLSSIFGGGPMDDDLDIDFTINIVGLPAPTDDATARTTFKFKLSSAGDKISGELDLEVHSTDSAETIRRITEGLPKSVEESVSKG